MLTNEQYMLIHGAFQHIGNMRKDRMLEQHRSWTTQHYEGLRSILKDGHPTIGDAMIARGLADREMFYGEDE